MSWKGAEKDTDFHRLLVKTFTLTREPTYILAELYVRCDRGKILSTCLIGRVAMVGEGCKLAWRSSWLREKREDASQDHQFVSLLPEHMSVAKQHVIPVFGQALCM